MTGETELRLLLQTMEPTLLHDDYAFITLRIVSMATFQNYSPKLCLWSRRYDLVLPEALATKFGYAYESVFQCITLQIHSR